MKRIVVTGAKGGTGTGICQVLRDADYAVTAIDRVSPGDGDTDYIQLDLGDAAGVNDAFAGADGVVHFGSVPGTDRMSTTAGFHNVAVAGFNVFQAARNVGIRRVVWASSVETYGGLPRTPESPGHGRQPPFAALHLRRFQGDVGITRPRLCAMAWHGDRWIAAHADYL